MIRKFHLIFFMLSISLITGCASTVQFVPMPDQSKNLDKIWRQV